MSDRIDHAAEAVRLADTADRHYGQIEHRNGAMAASQSVESLMIATEAQVHATLALVEQQRIANLIALANVADTSDAAVSPLEQTAWEALGIPGSGAMRPEIREALGLS